MTDTSTASAASTGTTSVDVATLPNAITVKDSDATATAYVGDFTDAAGNVTTPDDIPQWQSNDPTVVSISSVSVDGLSAQLVYGQPGSVTLTVTSTDTDGVKLTATGTVIVEAGEATAVGPIGFDIPAPVAVVPAAGDPDAPSVSDAPAGGDPAATETGGPGAPAATAPLGGTPPTS